MLKSCLCGRKNHFPSTVPPLAKLAIYHLFMVEEALPQSLHRPSTLLLPSNPSTITFVTPNETKLLVWRGRGRTDENSFHPLWNVIQTDKSDCGRWKEVINSFPLYRAVVSNQRQIIKTVFSIRQDHRCMCSRRQ
jgi:hypothetical protein